MWLKVEFTFFANVHQIIIAECREHSFLDFGRPRKSTKETNLIFFNAIPKNKISHRF
ncbi:uncharacterized protein METZ01_LOCUS250189 [marine metagenome]|uniref:Uncharacterized protein n=1 Tax=marine metagenome TaxID=408172 RepID=A0A382IDB3_9ZZZZ